MDACLLLLYLILFFTTKPRDWLRRSSSSPKWPFCRVGCKTLTQSISQQYSVTMLRGCVYCMLFSSTTVCDRILASRC